VVKVGVDDAFRLRVDLLERAMDEDRARGMLPLAVVATVGTTSTTSIDPVGEIAELCRSADVWLHVDGAYGLPGAGAPSAAPLFAGLKRADSATIDAHKWLGVQKSCSVVLLRETGRLQAAFGHEERYMLHEGDVANPVDRTLEYSRPFRSLRLWMAFRVYGAGQYRTWIEATLANARLLTDALRDSSEFELLHDPMLSTVCFRHVPPQIDNVDEHNVKLAREMQRDGRVFLAPASVDGHACLRVCFVNFRTTAEEVAYVLEVAKEIGQRLAGSSSRQRSS
jgi:aromatic-L-amino-acid decarboxylase